MNEFLGRGIYTFSEAARLLKLRPARVSEWFNSQRLDGVFHGDYSELKHPSALSFLDLIDALVATKLRNEGVSLRTVRKAYDRLEKDFGTRHPFCHKELLTDGNTVFLRSLSEAGEEQITSVVDRQRLFPKVIAPYLKQLDYNEKNRMAERWNIKSGICVDPSICLGKPIVKSAGIPTRILAEEFKANDKDAKLVALWFNVKPHDVKAAYDFECELAA